MGNRRYSRRHFLEQAALGAGAVALNGYSAFGKESRARPDGARSRIDHIVVVMMENRSFDHMLGWHPGAEGEQAGLTYVDRAGIAHPTYALADDPVTGDFQGCGHPDPDHSVEGGRIEHNGGACDGWLRAGENDEFAIGYYTENALPFFARAAVDWTTCDNYFTSMMGPTFPNRFYQHCAQTDRVTNTFAISTLPTIWDRLAERGRRGRYYFQDAPFLALWGPKYLPITRHYTSFLLACATGTLPDVSFVEPKFVPEVSGVTNDDHPHADVRDGQAFLNQVYTAVTRSPAWSRTLLVINYDEWGGFYEHVPPPTRPVPPGSAEEDGLLGFRVPALLISPYARRNTVSSIEFDHTSVLRFIEWRWGLRPLTVRDETANNIAEALDFRRRNRSAPRYLIPPGPYGAPCPESPLAPEPNKWFAVREMARGFGFVMPE